VKIVYSKKFIKQLKKQSAKIQELFYARIIIFEDDPNSASLRNHALQGKLKGYYSINITGDIRALYQIVGDEVYLYDMIGSHSQLYG
jgi:addiction module RelE/StbE family toxin